MRPSAPQNLPSVGYSKRLWHQQKSLGRDLAAGKHLLQLPLGNPRHVVFVGLSQQPSIQREITQKSWRQPGVREPMKKGRSEVWINGKKAGRCLAVNPLANAHHLAGKFELVLFTPRVLDRRV